MSSRSITFRSEAQTRGHVANAIVAIGVFVVVALFVPPQSPLPWKMLVVAVGVVLATWSLYAARTFGVTATPRGIVVRNPFSCREVPWNQVARFEMMESWPFTAVLRTTDGGRLKLWAIAGRGASAPAAQLLVSQLNQLKAQSSG